MARELRPHGPWDVKLRAGGLIDVEFVAQVLQLIHARDTGFRRSQTTRVALRRLSVAGVIAKPDVAVLIEAERLWRTIQSMLRMTVGQVDSGTLPQASALPLLHAAAAAGVEAEDSDDLLRRVDEIAVLVRALFERYVGKVEA